MGCGCRGKSGGNKVLPQVNHAGVAPTSVKRVAVYNVVKNNETVLTTTNPTAARTEARRLGGSVKVSSRPVTEDEKKELVS